MNALPDYHRAVCPACGVLCEQRLRPVLFPDGAQRVAYECLECEVIHLATESAVTLQEKVRL
jgi:hypothetical protein